MLAREVREPRPAEASRLQLDPGVEVIAVRRLRLADDEPVAIEEAVFPAALAAAASSAPTSSTARSTTPSSRAATSRRMGRARLGAEAAGPDDAALLDVPVGSPLLVEKRVIHDQDGNPLESASRATPATATGSTSSSTSSVPAAARRRAASAPRARSGSLA